MYVERRTMDDGQRDEGTLIIMMEVVRSFTSPTSYLSITVPDPVLGHILNLYLSGVPMTASKINSFFLFFFGGGRGRIYACILWTQRLDFLDHLLKPSYFRRQMVPVMWKNLWIDLFLFLRVSFVSFPTISIPSPLQLCPIWGHGSGISSIFDIDPPRALDP